jgi:hypothetical protein
MFLFLIQGHKFVPKSREEDAVSYSIASNVILKNLKSVIIESTGKIIHENVELKEKYYYKYNFSSMNATKHNSYKYEQEFDWIKRSRIYLQSLLNLLDSTQLFDRDLQYEILKFLRFIVKNDLRMQNCLISTNDVSNSHLTNSLRNLFTRKALPKKFTKAVLFCLWSMTNEDRFFDSLDRKCLIYRELGVSKVVDTFLECEETPMSEILLEAIAAVSICSPRRDPTTGRLIVIQEELSTDANPIMATMLKYFRHASYADLSESEETVAYVLRIISLMTVSSGYVCNVKNQMTALKYNCIDIILGLTKRKNISAL